MDTSDILSIIGCVTGSLSLAVSALENRFQTGKQIFSISQQRATFYFSAADTTVKGCWKPTYCAVVSIKAMNKSSYPITISEAVIKRNGFTARHYNEFEFENIYIKESEESETCADTESSAILPLKLEPFETKYFSFSFPYFENFVSKYGEDINVQLTITTVRKNHKISVTIPEYYGLLTKRENNSASKSFTGRSAKK